MSILRSVVSFIGLFSPLFTLVVFLSATATFLMLGDYDPLVKALSIQYMGLCFLQFTIGACIKRTEGSEDVQDYIVVIVLFICYFLLFLCLPTIYMYPGGFSDD